ncbi:MAG: EpsI family protein [Candidatus Omnitrophica bacterium]|nr:EpsI family protein [Candidatus Omnitrophota bacterium]
MVARIFSPRVIALLVLLGAAWLVWQGAAPAQANAPMAAAGGGMPSALPGWQVEALPADARSLQLLETDDVILAKYRLGEQPPVWLVQVAGFGNRAAFHPPELCFVGSNFEVLARGPLTVDVHGRPRRLMRLVVGRGKDRMEAWYWFTAGERVTPSYYRQQLWLVADTLRGRPASGTLVRISTPLDNPAQARERLLSFMGALMRQRDTTPDA